MAHAARQTKIEYETTNKNSLAVKRRNKLPERQLKQKTVSERRDPGEFSDADSADENYSPVKGSRSEETEL